MTDAVKSHCYKTHRIVHTPERLKLFEDKLLDWITELTWIHGETAQRILA